jgi:transglutaminase-like putative cysteine protease
MTTSRTTPVRIREETVPRGEPADGGRITQTVEAAKTALADDGHHRPAGLRSSAVERVLRAAAYPQLILAAVAVATTALPYLSFFSGLDFLIALLVAAGGGVLTAGLAGARHLRTLPTLVACLLAFLPVAVFAAGHSTLRHGVPTWDTLRGLGTGLTSGWARMLSVTLPADATPELVFTPALLTWIAATVSATLVVRTRSLLAPAVPPLLTFAAALLFTAGHPLGGFVPVGAFLVSVLTLVLARAGAADPAARIADARAAWGRFAFGVPVVLVAAAAGLAGMHYLPLATGQHRFDPRTVLPVQLDIGDTISPLATLKSQLRAPAHDLFTVRFTGDPAGVDRVRTAALDDYDGALWAAHDRFLLAGKSLPAGDNLTAPRQVSLSVRISGLSGPYLPEAGEPVRTTAPRVGYSAQSGVLATDAPTLSGLGYDLVAQVGRKDGLEHAVPAADDGHDSALPPGLPPELQEQAAALAGAVDEPWAKLMALQERLRRLPYSLDARPGHSYDALRRLFGANPADQVGYAEQFAAAFAVLARSQGFPTRVAVGYLLNPARLKDGTYTVTSADAHAWPEVHLAGYGWVAFDPTDPLRHGGVAPKQPDTPPAGNTANDRPDDHGKASQVGVDPNLPKLDGGRLSVLDWALIVLIGLGALMLLTPIAVAVEKVRRRRARRSGSRAARITGAWQETTDRLTENGIRVSASSTAGEVAHQAGEVLGERAGAVALLAPLVTAAVYSPAEPDDTAVAEAWGLDARLRRELRGTRGPFVALRAWFDPRPLFDRRRDARRRRRALEKLTRG